MSFPPRPQFTWQLRSGSLALGARTLVMGILNITPDSFSDGGLYREAGRATDRALELMEEGADLLDIGGESTRPGSHRQVSVEQELDRVLPVIEAVLKARPGAILSIDTYKAATARACLRAGAEIVNDVSGFLWEPELAEVCAAEPCGVVLMHTRGTPNEWRTLPPLPHEEVLPLVRRELGERLAAARRAGIAAERIVLDPGYGFGKAFDANYPLLGGQGALLELGQPLLVGVSRKSFLRHTLERRFDKPQAQLGGELSDATVAACTAAVLAGAHILRVHEVHRAVAAVAVADDILRA